MSFLEILIGSFVVIFFIYIIMWLYKFSKERRVTGPVEDAAEENTGYEGKIPVIKASICNGEQVAGFKDPKTGEIEEIMLIKSPEDLEKFKKEYGIDGDIEKIY